MRVTAPPARGFARLVGRPWFWALSISILFGLPLVRTFLRPAPSLPPMRAQVPVFTLTRETAQPFGSRELSGKVWVAARFGDDTPAARAMLELERRMRKLGDAFALVSLARPASPGSPASGDPATLAAWARAHKTNSRRWALLYGPPAVTAPLAAALELDAPGAANDATLVLVDAHGRVRGRYDAGPSDRDALEQLIYDAALLVNNY